MRTLKLIALFVVLVPRNVAIGLLKIYRVTISPLYGDVCKFYPSCSRYGLEAVTEHGVIRGSGLTLRRLGRCHPWALGGVDDVPVCKHPHFVVTKQGFVLPATGRS